jgi:hypothetical protein
MKKSMAALALGIGAGSAYVLNRQRRARKARNKKDDGNGNLAVDDQHTDQTEAANMLRQIRDSAFDASDEKFAVALGRPTEEIRRWTSGSGVIDDDAVMKARGLAIQRGVEIQ